MAATADGAVRGCFECRCNHLIRPIGRGRELPCLKVWLGGKLSGERAVYAASFGWRRFRRRLRVSAIGWKSVVDQLRSNCYAKAHDNYREGIKRCERK